jgi:hypothetical protein
MLYKYREESPPTSQWGSLLKYRWMSLDQCSNCIPFDRDHLQINQSKTTTYGQDRKNLHLKKGVQQLAVTNNARRTFTERHDKNPWYRCI